MVMGSWWTPCDLTLGYEASASLPLILPFSFRPCEGTFLGTLTESFLCHTCLTALTSPIEYQRNHSGGGGSGGGGGGGGAPSSGGSSSNHSSGPSSCSGLPTSSRSRPSRIPQPVRHHSPVLVSSAASSQAEADKMSGMSTPGRSLPPPSSSPAPEAGPGQPGRPPAGGEPEGPEPETEPIPKMKVMESPRKSSRSAAGAHQDGATKEAPAAPDDSRSRSSLGSLPLGKPRPGAISPLNSPLATAFPSPFGKEPLPPSSPLQKGGSFWSSIPASPASRPGSFTFPGDSDSLQRQAHRHAAPGKDTDRMSTCSSASEQSVQSTQSNGVRAPSRLRPPAPLPLSRGSSKPPASSPLSSY